MKGPRNGASFFYTPSFQVLPTTIKTCCFSLVLTNLKGTAQTDLNLTVKKRATA